MEHTTVNNILAAVKLELEIEQTNYDSWLKLAINEYIREFNCFETYVKKEVECRIDERGWICLPEDFYSLGMLTAQCESYPNWNQYQQSLNPEHNPNFQPANNPRLPFVTFVYFEQNWVNNNGCSLPNGYGTGTYQINGNKIKIMGNFDRVHSAILSYEAYQTDERGSFVGVPKDFESAVMFRISHRFMLKHRKDYASDVIQWYDAKATAMYNQVKGKSTIRSFRRNRPALLDIQYAILTDKNIRRR